MGSAKWMMGVAAAALMAGQAKADLVITNKATQNVSCSNGTCTATAPNAALNVSDLTDMLAGGDVKVATGGGATNIAVNVSLSWTSTSRLTLDANQSITIIRPVTVAGTGAVTIATDDGGSGGDFMFAQTGKLNFWDTGSSLVINGQSYTLVNSIATLASAIANNASGFYALANDYDASVDGTYTSAPVTTTFDGTFEGLGHALSNLKIVSSKRDSGLFATTNAAVLRDIQLLNVSIQGTSKRVGSLLAESDNTIIAGCHATGSIVLTGRTAAGGLIGASDNGTLTRSDTTVDVSVPDKSTAGGLVGSSSFNISLSHASGTVTAGDKALAGGLAAFGGGNIAQSYATGAVTAGKNAVVGGLVGQGGNISNSYARGPAIGGNSAIVGGLMGKMIGGNISSSYSTGHVTGGRTNQTGGGFLGEKGSSTSAASDYWDIDTSGKKRQHGCGNHCGPRSGILGLKTAEFLSALPNGFDPSIWAETAGINGGYPYLIANPPNQ